MKRWLAGWWAMLLLALAPAVLAGVRATLDTQETVPGDTVELTLERDGQSSAQPDLAPLNQDFDVLGTRSGSSIQIINGRMSSTAQVVITLSPKNTGRLTIPSLTWGPDRTQPLTLYVRGAGSPSGGNASQAQPAPPVFIETQVDTHQPYVQAAVDVTVKLYFSEPLRQASLTLAQSADALVMQVGQDTQSSAEKDGRQYQVITRHYNIFPQRSGEVQLAGPSLDAQVESRSRNRADPLRGFFSSSPFGALMNPTRPLRLHGEPISLSVQTRPADAGNAWIPARAVQLNAQWKPNSLQVHVGEPVTVELQLQADGLTAEQLPDITSLWTLPSGLRAYPDQPKLENQTKGTTVSGKRTQSVALIADDADSFSIPELRLRWWDVAANISREVTLPGRTITVLPAGGSVLQRPSSAAAQAQAAPNVPPPLGAVSRQQPPGVNVWRWTAVGMGALWVATVLAWLWSRRHANARKTRPATFTEAPAPDVSAVRNAFREACRKGDALVARRNLLVWVAAERGPGGPMGLNALARESQDPELVGLLRDLDRACFSSTPWNGEALERSLRKLPAPPGARQQAKTGLAPLYP